MADAPTSQKRKRANKNDVVCGSDIQVKSKPFVEGNVTVQDRPMDLSLPKSRLKSLLCKSEGTQPAVSHDTFKKDTQLQTCSNIKHNVVVDMNDAVDNPVQIVELANCCIEEVRKIVSNTLTQVFHKVFNLTSFHMFSEIDRTSLLQSSWHRLMLWLLAYQNFTFKIAPKMEDAENSSSMKGSRFSMNQPTMAFVKTIATFLQKYRTMNIDETELYFLFCLTVFHGGHDVCCNFHLIDNTRKDFMVRLQHYISQKDPTNGMRYTELLLYLPMLYGVNEKMFEVLFFSHIPIIDVKLLIKDTIRSLR